MTKDVQERAFLAAVSDGMKPHCPRCSGDMELDGPQVGESGGKGYSYRCSNPNCEVRGFLHIPWYRIFYKAAVKRTLTIGLSAIGMLSAGGIAGYVFNEAPGIEAAAAEVDSSTLPPPPQACEEAPAQACEVTPEQVADLEMELKSLQREKAAFKQRVEELSAAQLSPEERLSLGIYYAQPSTADPGIRNNSSKAIEILFSAARDPNASFGDRRWIEIVSAMTSVRESIEMEEDFELLISLIRSHLKADAQSSPHPDLALAQVYWAYGYLPGWKARKERRARSLYHLVAYAASREAEGLAKHVDDAESLLGDFVGSCSIVADRGAEVVTAFREADRFTLADFEDSWSVAIAYPKTPSSPDAAIPCYSA